MKDDSYCVYVHTNKTNGKKYYGITHDIGARWGSDGSRYIDSTCKAFGAAVKKYGWDGFEHTVLEEGITKQRACELERQYIARDKTNICRYGDKYGYNMTDGGEGVCGGYDKSGGRNPFYGKHHTDDTKQKISISRSGKRSGVNSHKYRAEVPESTRSMISSSLREWFSEHRCPTRRPVYCVTDDKWFDSLSDAAKFYGISPGLISGCCTGYAISTHGKQFTYNDDGSLPEYHGAYGTVKNKQRAQKARCNAAPVICVETGELFVSLAEAARHVGLKCCNGIRESCKNNNHTSGGYHWRYG